MRIIAIGLIVGLLAATSTFAQEAHTWRKVADAIPLGTKVKIQTLEGKRVSGTLMRVDDTAVAVKKNTRIPEAPIQVTFEQVANIERDSGGIGWGKAIGIGVATGASAILTIFVIALQLN